MTRLSRTVQLLVPVGPWTRHGGSMFAQDLRSALEEFADVETVCYTIGADGMPVFQEGLPRSAARPLWVMYWGPHIDALQRRLWGQPVVLFAQSADCYEFSLSPQTAVVCLSRFIQSSFALRFPHNPVCLLYPLLRRVSFDPLADRPVDILHVPRKSAPYMREGPLLPLLRQRFRVEEVTSFVDREALLGAYTRSKVYLYSLDVERLGIEGLGVQPLEALLHGAWVLSELGAGLSDFLTPQHGIRQIGVRSVEWDFRTITEVLRRWEPVPPPAELLALTDAERYRERVQRAFLDIEAFHDFAPPSETPYGSLVPALAAARARRSRPGVVTRLFGRLRDVRSAGRVHGG